MGKLFSFIALGLLAVPIALLVVSFTRPWYETKMAYGGGSIIYNYKTIEYKDQPYLNYTISYSKSFDNDSELRHSLKVFQSAYVFSIMAWCLHVISAGLIVASIFITLPGFVKLVPRFLPTAALSFTLIALFIFLGLPNAIKVDCRDYNNFGQLCLPMGQRDKLIGKDDNGFKWGVLEGWICVVVSAAFSLASAVIALFFIKFKE